MEILGIVPARGGSKGIIRKNLRKINGHPLIKYTIDEAKKSKLISRVIVSTDDEEIASISKGLGAEVPFLRDFIMGEDDVPLVPTLFQYVINDLSSKESYNPDVAVMLQPTSPLRNSKDIDKCITRFLRRDVDFVTSISEVDVHPYRTRTIDSNGILSPIIDNQLVYAQRQELPSAYFFNGAVYVSSPEVLNSQKDLRKMVWAGVEIDKKRSLDIDTEEDLIKLEKFLNEN